MRGIRSHYRILLCTYEQWQAYDRISPEVRTPGRSAVSQFKKLKPGINRLTNSSSVVVSDAPYNVSQQIIYLRDALRIFLCLCKMRNR
ncbi:hypothetical protein SUGI_1175400 [Cryptomeria japonica]|nr:hypothetical protein SUGI_1175400 [Cryptomeria japonica]